MTADDITRLTPLVEDLQRKGVVATWSTTSWPGAAKRAFDSNYNLVETAPAYVHAFRLRSRALVEPLVIEQLFTEQDLVRRLAAAEARQTHGPSIESAFMQSKEALYTDLTSMYESRLYGKELPIPSVITIKDLRVPLVS